MKSARWVLIAALISSPFWYVSPAQSAVAAVATAKKASSNVTVSGSPKWVDTKIDVAAGDKLHITAKGTVTWARIRASHLPACSAAGGTPYVR